ncbi:hypothetical protein [Streptomyces sp. NBC_01483]|uniref:hypothetical protein n=1 Tax=Streptomyces sp. NBC_01483 TaxID=2903883 RepID=UPI002E31E962|nr:hypothetical protein [Streptomyces sp. NBC_01483]
MPSGPLPRSPPESLLCPQGPLARAAIGGLGAEAGLIIGYYGYAEFGRDGRNALLAYALIELPLKALTLRMTRGTS